MPVPPDRSNQPIVVIDREPREQAEQTSGGERAMLTIVALVLFVLFVAAIIYPHTPFAAE